MFSLQTIKYKDKMSIGYTGWVRLTGFQKS
jgi:hypothetical protein